MELEFGEFSEYKSGQETTNSIYLNDNKYLSLNSFNSLKLKDFSFACIQMSKYH